MPNSSSPGDKFPTNYRILTSLLEEHAVTISASEIHGMICGLLCSEQIAEDSNLNLAIFDDQAAKASEALKMSFIQIMSDLKPILAEGQLDFALLLPDDQSDISERTESLANWCRGTIFGLVEGGLRNFESLSGEASEMLHDMIALSEMEIDADDESDEQQERDIAEIEEYLKIGVQFIYEELHATDKTKSSPEQEL